MSALVAPVRPGDIVADKYLVKEVIGQGGVGVVVAADHLTLRCPVALKFLRQDIAHDPDSAQRFLREARAVARLRGEHVARVMDADSTPGGAAYLVMEYLEGRDFAAIVKEDGPLPIPVAVDYLLQACEAVAEAHAAGIVHRDIKSANLFLTRRADGVPLVKVLDFGLSKVESSESRASAANLTSVNHVIGSPHYMSPEQMRSSRDVDARSDIWALGVVLYTFLAGRVPFQGAYLTEVCAAVLSGSPPSLATIRPEVPAGLVDVISRCLQLEPEDRYQRVAELVGALAPFGAQSSGIRVSPEAPTLADGSIRSVPSRSRLRRSVPVVGAAIVAGAVALAVLHRSSGGVAPPTAAAAAPSASAVAEAVLPVATMDPAVAATVVAPIVTSSPPVPRGQARPVAGARRAPRPSAPTAAPAPAPAPSKPDETIIMGLPH